MKVLAVEMVDIWVGIVVEVWKAGKGSFPHPWTA
jgi:hypothetical protein